MVGEQEHLKALNLHSGPEGFHLGLEIERLGVHTHVSLPFSCTDFTVEKLRREARFRFSSDEIQAQGQNWVGKILGNLPAAILLKALQGPDFAAKLSSASHEAATLKWPELRVDLEQSPELNAILAFEFMGLGLLDIFQLGPLEPDHDRVWVQVRPLWSLN